MQKARCIKCGRKLKAPESITRGMGPKCAGISSKSQGMQFRMKKPSESAYPLGLSENGQQIMLIGYIQTPKISKIELIRTKRRERRMLFEGKKAFQCGVVSSTHAPLIYLPLPDGNWKEKHSGRTIPEENLYDYLRRYRFI